MSPNNKFNRFVGLCSKWWCFPFFLFGKEIWLLPLPRYFEQAESVNMDISDGMPTIASVLPPLFSFALMSKALLPGIKWWIHLVGRTPFSRNVSSLHSSSTWAHHHSMTWQSDPSGVCLCVYTIATYENTDQTERLLNISLWPVAGTARRIQSIRHGWNKRNWLLTHYAWNLWFSRRSHPSSNWFVMQAIMLVTAAVARSSSHKEGKRHHQQKAIDLTRQLDRTWNNIST